MLGLGNDVNNHTDRGRQALRKIRNENRSVIPFSSNIFPKTEGAYVVGGSIRDVLLERIPTDYDIAVKGNPEEFARKMASNRAGHVVEMGKAGQKIFRVILNKHIFDISSLNGTCIEDDLKKRDFTINAVAYDLFSGKIIDCAGGLKDLADKCIRMVSETIFTEDPIRLIRAYRMSACLAFNIDKRTAAMIKNQAEQIKYSAGERVRTELFKILGTATSYNYLSQMAETDLLTTIIPELSPLKGCFQNNRHVYDVFEHSMKAYQQLETIVNDFGKYFPGITIPTHQKIGAEKTVLLKCSMLLHDVGKSPAKTIDNDGNTRFYGHASKSADMAQKISQRLKFSTRDRRFVDSIIRNHMKPLFLFNANQKKTLKPNGLTRFFIKSGDNMPYLLLHAMGDTKAKQAGKASRDFISFIREMMRYFFDDFKPRSEKPRLVTGYDLIHVFALPPSPLFKTILDNVEEARLANRIHNRSQALDLVGEFLNEMIRRT